MALSRTTRDHQDIRSWAEARGAKPAEVGGTESGGQSGILRLEFPNAPHANDSKLQEISWEEFFQKFDERGLAMILQDVTAEGEESNFNRFVYPENTKGEVIPNTSSASGGDESEEDDEQFEDAAVDEPGDVDADAGDPDDAEFVHESAADAVDEDDEELDTAVKSASRSASKTAAKKTATNKAPAKKSASSKTGGTKTDTPRTASKASAKKATTNSARGRH